MAIKSKYIISLFLWTVITCHSFAGWYSTGGTWLYRKAIKVNSGQVISGPQSNFTVLVNLSSDAELKNHAMSNGFDILFTDNTGTNKIPYEREKYDNSTGALTAWVKASSVDNGTLIYMYYGNSLSADQQASSTNAWDANYIAVWHMTGTTSPATESKNGFNATFGANDTYQTGKIGSCLQNNGTGAGALYQYTKNSLLDFTTASTPTLSYWIYINSYTPGSPPATRFFESLAVGGWGVEYYGPTQPTNPSSFWLISFGKAGPYGIWNNQTATGSWIYVVFTYNGGATANFSKNGGTLTSSSFTCQWENTTANYPRPLYIGGDVGYPHNGMLDEVRVSNIARSQGWVTTEFNNQNSPSTFYTMGFEEPIIVTVTNVLCNGFSTGSATASVTGGTTPYSYAWSTSPKQTTQTAASLPAASYTVTVTDFAGSSATASATITQTTAVTVSSSSTNISCFGTTTGSISINAGGGTSPYTYSIDNGGNYSPGSNPLIISGLAAGSYRIRAKDANNCTSPSVP